MRNQPCMKRVCDLNQERTEVVAIVRVQSKRGNSHRECMIWMKVFVTVREWEWGLQRRVCGWREMSESKWGVGAKWSRPTIERNETRCREKLQRNWNSLIFAKNFNSCILYWIKFLIKMIEFNFSLNNLSKCVIWSRQNKINKRNDINNKQENDEWVLFIDVCVLLQCNRSYL